MAGGLKERLNQDVKQKPDHHTRLVKTPKSDKDHTQREIRPHHRSERCKRWCKDGHTYSPFSACLIYVRKVFRPRDTSGLHDQATDSTIQHRKDHSFVEAGPHQKATGSTPIHATRSVRSDRTTCRRKMNPPLLTFLESQSLHQPCIKRIIKHTTVLFREVCPPAAGHCGKI